MLNNNKGGTILKLAIIVAVIGLIFFLVKPQELLKKIRLKPAPKEVAPPEEVIQVKTYKLGYAPFEDALSVLGTVKGVVDVELRFEVNGVISAINFREGDLIEKDEVIAMLDQRDALLKIEFNKSKLKASQAQAQAAEKKLEIHHKLYDVGAIIKSKLEEVTLECEAANAQAESAQKELEFAESELRKTYMRSPIDGVMGTRDVEVGEYVTPQTKVGTVFDIKEVYVEVGIIEKDITNVKLGQKVKINVDTYAGKDFFGEIDNVPSLVESKARTLPCKVKIANIEGLLKPGMFARCEILVFQSEHALMMPATGLFDSDGDGTLDSAFIVDEEGRARLRQVKIGYLTTESAEIIDGLYEGETAIVETAKRLEDGVKVEVVETVAGM